MNDGGILAFMDESRNLQNDELLRIMQAMYAVNRGEYKPEMLGNLKSEASHVGQLALLLDEMARQVQFRDRQLNLLRTVIPAGVALSAEKDFNRLLETVVVKAQEITNADAGTLYLMHENSLRFVIVRNTSLNMAMGGTTGNAVTFKPIPLYKESGVQNLSNVASYVALTHTRVNIPDAYEAEGFDFSGTRLFDERTGYRSKSFLAAPLEGKDKEGIGVLQLINAKDPVSGEIITFEADDVLESLILLAAAALDGYIREQKLRQEIDRLRVEIDETRRSRQVADITETAYFRDLQKKAHTFRLGNADDKKDKG